MSAVEWLPFISPFVWVLLILNALALLPIKLTSHQPARVKFTLLLFVMVLFGWLMALMATHILNPVARINVLQGSQVILTPSLITLVILLVLRLIQGKNLLTTLIKGLGRALRPCVDLLTLAVPPILHILSGAFSAPTQDDERRKKEEREMQDKIHINWKGEYSGKNDENKY